MDNRGETRQRRIIFNWDEECMWLPIVQNMGTSPPSAQVTKRILHEIVDEHAAAGVDTIVQCVFGAGWRSHLPSSKATDLVPDRPPGLDELGLDWLQMVLDDCRQHHMEFIAGLRMNDRHGMGTPSKFVSDHPQWQLSLGGWSMNYGHEPVREHMLTITEEVLDAYNVDGIEFDYMRWCHMFEKGEGAEHAPLLTEFTRKARQLLDSAAERRGRGRLVLGVRVPQTLEECEYLGFDVAGWIREGLVDWVVPSDFFYTAFNARTEDFVKLAAGTACKIYPAIHPPVCWTVPSRTRIMSLANYRAAAQNFYAAGADGISPYNYQGHWGQPRGASRCGPAYMWPAALGYLRELRDPQKVKERDRHYLFYPLWAQPRASESGFCHDDNIYLDRAGRDLAGSRRFRLSEDLSDARLRGTLQFKAVGLREEEALEILLNGAPVPAEYVARFFDEDGQKKSEGRVLPAFYLYAIDLNWWGDQKPPVINGDNRLSVRLIPAGSGGEGMVVIDELEAYVYVRK